MSLRCVNLSIGVVSIAAEYRLTWNVLSLVNFAGQAWITILLKNPLFTKIRDEEND
jgi:hypothetical protein